MKIVTVVGARPNFMKAAPIIAAIREHNERADRTDLRVADAQRISTITHILVHTGQHYDSVMSDSFFADLNLPPPDIQLGVGSGSHAVQTAEILKRFDEVLLRERPDVVIVVGDVNSTVACAVATAKTSFDSLGTRPLLAHVEAGLRSFDRTMPEEVNRVLTDHISDLLFVTEESGLQNLRNEGLPARAIHFVGNTMIDSLFAFQDKADASTILERLKLRAEGDHRGPNSIARYALLTLHRPSNVDDQNAFGNILAGLEQLAANCPVIFPVHPRTRRRLEQFALDVNFAMIRRPGSHDAGVIVTDPLGYLDFLCLMKHAAIVVTDSGGIQEETTCLGIPCVTVRENTERPVTVESGTNVIAGTTKEAIAAAIRRQMGKRHGNGVPKNWDGHAAERILSVLIDTCRAQPSSLPSGVSTDRA